MFHLVNPFGNVHKYVKSEAKKNELLKAGYKLVEEETTAEEPPQSAIEKEAPEADSMNTTEGAIVAEEETESPLSPDGDIPPLGKGGVDDIEGDTHAATVAEEQPKAKKSKKTKK